MSFTSTTNYGLQKPGIGDSGWGDEMNANLDVIDTQIKARQTAIDAHTGTGSAKHSASQIATSAGSDVETALATKATTAALTAHTGATSGAHADTAITSSAISGYATVNAALARLNASKAATSHQHLASEIDVSGNSLDLELERLTGDITSHLASVTAHADTAVTSSAIPSYGTVNAALQYLKSLVDTKASNAAVTALQNLVNLLEPDLTGVTITTEASATTQGIHVAVSTTPAIYVMRYNLLIKRNGATVYNGSAGASYSFIYAFSDGDSVEITPTIFAGSSYKIGPAKTITWHNPNSQPGVTLSFIAADTSHAITEAALQSLLGWSAANGQSVHKSVAVISLLHHESTPGNYTLVPATGTVKSQSTNSVEHLDALTLTGLTKDHLYSAYLQVQQINTK